MPPPIIIIERDGRALGYILEGIWCQQMINHYVKETLESKFSRGNQTRKAEAGHFRQLEFAPVVATTYMDRNE